MSYILFIDDERDFLPTYEGIVFDSVSVLEIARSSLDAKLIVRRRGIVPKILLLDHDLGGDDTVMVFLKWLAEEYYETPPEKYNIHSQNPVGRQNIESFMNSWINSRK